MKKIRVFVVALLLMPLLLLPAPSLGMSCDADANDELVASVECSDDASAGISEIQALWAALVLVVLGFGTVGVFWYIASKNEGR